MGGDTDESTDLWLDDHPENLRDAFPPVEEINSPGSGAGPSRMFNFFFPLIFHALIYSPPMRLILALLLFVGSWLPAIGANPVSLQAALKQVPRESAKNLVRIEAREGAPLPDCWYVQVYDPADEFGLHEFAITAKGVTASRPLSQFLTSAKPEDVIGAKLVKIDTDDLIKLVQTYAEANHLDVANINYLMMREAPTAPPVWKLSCLDSSGKKLAELVVNARNANVISHDGFDLAPGQTAKPSPTATPAPGTSPAPAPTVKPAVAASKPATKPAATPAPAAPAANTESTPKKGGLFQRMFKGKPTPTP
jgi:hypothetical protein